MKKYYLDGLTAEERSRLTVRPSIDISGVYDSVRKITENVKQNGIKAVMEYAARFDGFTGDSLLVPEAEIETAEDKLAAELKDAIKTAYANIYKFHEKQYPKGYETETAPGILCSLEYRAIENVGLYIPGGSAVLPSTVLMLGIPAKIAGCKRVVLISPAKEGKMHPAVLYAAKLCGITEIYKAGGAHGVAMLAYGTDGIKKVDKIFGPGNQYVTAAKTLVSIDPDGAAIDMPAGPSELLVIADKDAEAAFVASDLLSQAEHGADSQVILVTDSEDKVNEVEKELNKQLALLSRKDIAAESLKNYFALVTGSMEDAISFSNEYAPEHLIINTTDAEKYKSMVQNAGSVFLGGYTPESAGDYASGTNHSLPTYGYARTIGGVNVAAFMKTITFQKISKEGLAGIAGTIVTLAEIEGLDAHANAVKIRKTDER